MNLHHLSIFHAIAETGSITAAAQRLHISQPALSRELKMFEDRLGIVLFERMPKGMRLTEAGRVLHGYATRLFALECSAEATMRELAEARSGRLSIGASNTIGTYVLPRVLAAFRQARPKVQVSLFVGNTGQVSQGVADMRFMLGFIEGPLHLDGLQATHLQDDEILPVVGAQHPLAGKSAPRIADLAGQALLMREEGSGTRELISELLRRHDIDDGDIMEFGNTEALKQAAIHHGGVAWLPHISMMGELADGRLRVLAIPELKIVRPLKLLRREQAPLEPLAELFLALLAPATAQGAQAM